MISRTVLNGFENKIEKTKSIHNNYAHENGREFQKTKPFSPTHTLCFQIPNYNTHTRKLNGHFRYIYYFVLLFISSVPILLRTILLHV